MWPRPITTASSMLLELCVEHNLLHVHALYITCDSIRSKRPCSLHNLLKTLTRDSNMAYNPLRESTRSGTWISRKIKSILTTYSSAYSWNKFLGKTSRLRAAPPFRRIPSRKWNKKYQGEKNLCQRAVHNAGSEPHGKVTSLPEFRTQPFFFFTDYMNSHDGLRWKERLLVVFFFPNSDCSTRYTCNMNSLLWRDSHCSWGTLQEFSVETI